MFLNLQLILEFVGYPSKICWRPKGWETLSYPFYYLVTMEYRRRVSHKSRANFRFLCLRRGRRRGGLNIYSRLFELRSCPAHILVTLYPSQGDFVYTIQYDSTIGTYTISGVLWVIILSYCYYLLAVVC